MYEIKYRQPEELADSGVDWIGIAPKDWEVIKLKFVMDINPAKSELRNKHKLCSFVPMNKIHNGIIEVDETKTIKEVFNGYTYFIDGDIVMAKVTPCFENGDIAIASNLVNGVAFGTTEINVFRAKRDYVTDFIYYKMQELHFMRYGSSHMTGVAGLKRIPTSYISNFKSTVPNWEDQQKIANFLDIKTAQFNSIIAKKELLIEKLEEAKKCLISEVVTGKMKIVDGEIVKRQPEEMKNCGIEWLGMIPKEWVVKRIKNLFALRNERNHKSMDEVQILSLYTALGVKRQEEIENKTGNIVRTVLDYKIVHPQDIVVNIILAWMGAIGVSKDKGVISPAYDIYKPYDNINSDYYSYLFRTSKFAGECFKYGRGIMLMRWRTYSDQFMSIYCCCPNKTEQDQIAEFIDRKIRDIDTVVEKNKLHIQKLKEAKQALISEAITGKIDLRDWEIIEEGGLQ